MRTISPNHSDDDAPSSVPINVPVNSHNSLFIFLLYIYIRLFKLPTTTTLPLAFISTDIPAYPIDGLPGGVNLFPIRLQNDPSLLYIHAEPLFPVPSNTPPITAYFISALIDTELPNLDARV